MTRWRWSRALRLVVCAVPAWLLAGCGDNTPQPVVGLDPGHATLRRLNRVEYNNTVRDLLGTAQAPADRFPLDETADGFDTVGEYLAFTGERAQSAEDAAAALVDELIALPPGDPRRGRILTCDLAPGDELTCARQILAGFARRAWRRQVTGDEIDDLVQVIDEAVAAGASPYEGLRSALTLVLISPHFLFHVETSPAPDSSDAQPLDDDQLAARLSYFLWSTMPDDDLFAAADAHTVASDLHAHVRRMLDDPRASALATEFAGQWLSLRSVAGFVADPDAFPTFTPELAAAAAQETTAFFGALVAQDLPVEALLLADFTFANARLGEDYGLDVAGEDLVRTSLVNTPRAGVLTQASFLMSTSLPSRTSPVKRGAWVLDRLLCAPPPPVPPDLPIPPLMVPPPGSTLRETLEEHRANPVCSPCHNVMDPIGLGLESFDAIGRYRTLDNGAAVDASGTLPTGQPFSGARELAALLAKDPRYATCAMQKMLTFAVGRPFSTPEGADYALALAGDAQARGKASWRGFIEAVATSAAFRTRRGVTP
jgi:Protein of unknown function (DUF1592)/Protein of unknown function (DUF1588)/Protein of unknown function (DUF1595)/Protein of unknown function (DUF1587)/Protein of unknown function (DUF1585)